MWKWFAVVLILASSCKDHRALDRYAKASGEDSFDHSAYDQLLQKHVDEEGRVDYSEWKAKDVPALDAYLDRVRGASPTKLSRPEALAFWINEYNALTIRAILPFYPVKSIKDKVSRVIGYNVWDDYKIKIAGSDLSLNDIEHRILRKMGEPRIHFALVCAAMGCPRLRNRAYTGSDLDRQLAENMNHFFRQEKNYQLDRVGKVVRLSSILDWYGDDFGKTEKERLAYCAQALPSDDREFLQSNDVKIRFIDYDWSLNELRKP